MSTQAAELSTTPSKLSGPYFNGNSTSSVHSSSDEDEQIVWKQGVNGVEKSQPTIVKQSSPAGSLEIKATPDVSNPGSKWHFGDGAPGNGWDITDDFMKLQIKGDESKLHAKTPVSDASDRAKSAGSRRGTEGSHHESPSEAPAAIFGSVTKGVESNAKKSDADIAEYVRRSPAQTRDPSKNHPSQGIQGSPESRYHGPDGRSGFGLPAARGYPYNANGVIPNGGHPLMHQLPGSAVHSPLGAAFPAHIQSGHLPQAPYSPHHIPPPRGAGRLEDLDLSAAMSKNSFGVANGMPPTAGFHPGVQDHSVNPYEMSLAHRNSYGAGANGQGYHSPLIQSPPPLSGASLYGPHGPHIAGHPYGSPPHPYPVPYGGPASSFDMVLQGSGIDDPTRAALSATLANRAQLRSGHQHSASDSATLRDSAAHSHTHSISLSHSLSHSPYSPQIPGSPYHPHSPGPYGYYPPIPPPSLHHQPNVMSHLSSSYSASLYAPVPTGATVEQDHSDPSLPLVAPPGSAGPSANNRKLGLYKTELCRSWEEKGSCRYGSKCQFAHGEDEIRKVSRHPKYKTEICRTFWVSGSCPYGKRCCFVHTELPASGAPGAPGGAAEGPRGGSTPGSTGNAGTPSVTAPTDGRARSMSTNSDPNDAPSSLLARITAKAHANSAAAAAAAANRSSDASPANGQYDVPTQTAIANAYAQYGRPAQSSFRVEASAPSMEDAFSASKGLPNFNTTTTTTSSGHSNGMHHRVSASVDFSAHTRHLGDGFELGGRVGMGHQRNPSASSVVHATYSTLVGNDSLPKSSSRTPDPRLSGHSTPFGVSNTDSNLSTSITPARGSPAPATSSRFMHERTASGGFNLSSTYMERSWA